MGWFDKVIDVGGNILGNVLENMGQEDPEQPDRSVQPGTTTGDKKTVTEIMFSDTYRSALDNLVTKMNEWGDLDRNFMEQVYRPFQEELVSANQQLIPLIAQNSGLALEESIKDLTSSDSLKRAFESNISAMGENITDTAARFKQELDNLPTEAERVGQAVSAVEQQFGRAGQEVRRRLAEQGQSASQSTERSLAIAKASAKAGAVGAAGEQARRERMDALSGGAGVFQNLQASQSGLLTNQQAMTQSGVGLTSNLGKPDQVGAVSDATKIGADISGGLGLTSTGVSETTQTVGTERPGVSGGVNINDYFNPTGDQSTAPSFFNPDGTPVDSPEVKKFLGTLNADEIKELKSFEQNRFGGNVSQGMIGGGNPGETLKANNPGLYDKITQGGGYLLGGAVGMLTGSKTLGKAVKGALDDYTNAGIATQGGYYDPVTGLPTGPNNSQSPSRNTGGMFGTGKSSSDYGAGERDSSGHSMAG